MQHQQLSLSELFNVESPVATECRRLLFNLHKIASKQELKSIIFTSAVGGEGKSTISSVVSITAARKGLKTLLIDADMRRPVQHKLFMLKREQGFAEILSEGAAVKSVIKKTSLDNLDIITAGKVIAHPSEIFDSSAIGRLINELKFYYDYTFMDTPPVIPVSDPMLLAQEVDGTILVIKAGETSREIATRAKDILAGQDTNLLGVVLNNSDNQLPYYYDYSYYGYDYKPTLNNSKKKKRTTDKSTAGTAHTHNQTSVKKRINR